ncbi:hypothetical protein [Lewinella sp. IMCC34191]|uniref:hypothetical protein n=1 Tax=Lewinella sp. IMCC34191 TaxID=2259172 RepID=UPI001300755B|nr:hypothetical protein [Lewinella sp. IMCC34191]
MLFPTLLTSLLLLYPDAGVKTTVLVNEVSQPNQYQLDIRLEDARRRQLTTCIAEVTGLELPDNVTDILVAETAGINLTYLAQRNHLALASTDYDQLTADRAREVGQELKQCLAVGITNPKLHP